MCPHCNGAFASQKALNGHMRFCAFRQHQPAPAQAHPQQETVQTASAAPQGQAALHLQQDNFESAAAPDEPADGAPAVDPQATCVEAAIPRPRPPAPKQTQAEYHAKHCTQACKKDPAAPHLVRWVPPVLDPPKTKKDQLMDCMFGKLEVNAIIQVNHLNDCIHLESAAHTPDSELLSGEDWDKAPAATGPDSTMEGDSGGLFLVMPRKCPRAKNGTHCCIEVCPDKTKEVKCLDFPFMKR